MRFVARLDRQRLVDLLGRLDDAIAQDAAAVLRQGADFSVYDAASAPTSGLAKIYRRRAAHVRRIGLDARGLDQAVERFEAAERETIGFAIVTDPIREYPIFLAADGSSVIACLSVPAEHP
jgi:hypothetical protein